MTILPQSASVGRLAIHAYFGARRAVDELQENDGPDITQGSCITTRRML